MSAQPVTKTPTSRSTLFVLTGLVILSIFVLVFVRVPSGGQTLSPSSTNLDGTRALAEILRDNGVAVDQVNPIDVQQLAGPDTTLVIDASAIMDQDVIDTLVNSRATIVLTANTWPDEWGLAGDPIYIANARLRAESDDEDAQEARGIGPIEWIFMPSNDDVIGCFPARNGYVWVQHPDHAQISYVADDRLFMNEFLAQEGNAAFVLRKLGSHPQVYWVAGNAFDGGDGGATAIWAGLPAWFFPFAAALTLTLGWWALHKGRRFGKLVPEPLPVVVPASEVNEGRSILYERGKNHAHAASALRAGTISRLAKGRGIPKDATPDVVITTLTRVSGYPPHVLAELLYDRPIEDDSDLITLATELDRFERDVNVR